MTVNPQIAAHLSESKKSIDIAAAEILADNLDRGLAMIDAALQSAWLAKVDVSKELGKSVIKPKELGTKWGHGDQHRSVG